MIKFVYHSVLIKTQLISSGASWQKSWNSILIFVRGFFHGHLLIDEQTITLFNLDIEFDYVDRLSMEKYMTFYCSLIKFEFRFSNPWLRMSFYNDSITVPS